MGSFLIKSTTASDIVTPVAKTPGSDFSEKKKKLKF